MMENPRPEKVAVVDEVRERFQAADAALLTEYRGLTVKPLADLRRQLRPWAASTRSTRTPWCASRPGRSVDERLDELLTGPTAITFVRRRRRRGGQDPARLRPDQPDPGA